MHKMGSKTDQNLVAIVTTNYHHMSKLVMSNQ